MKETTLEITNSEGNNGHMEVKSASSLVPSRGTYIVDERFYMKADHPTQNGNPKWDDYFKLENMIYNCTEGCKMCTQNMLLGRGDLFADIMFVGLAPLPKYNGRHNREVFGKYHNVGKRAQRIMDAVQNHDDSCRFWITNSVKCSCHDWEKRFSICRKWLEREIALIDPKIIVLFGGKAQKNLNVHEGALRDKHGTLSFYHSRINGKIYPCILSFHLTSRPVDFIWTTRKIQELADIITERLESYMNMKTNQWHDSNSFVIVP